ncbi:SPASM domain-containing protein [bacterium]|nr:SPASM domain-containing protein [bacterium]
MNDTTISFIPPEPEVSWLRRQARSMRRGYLRARMNAAPPGQLKRWNSELNWREFWHGCTRLESMPRLVQVGTNWTCNLKCSFCRLTMPWTRESFRNKPAAELQITPRVESAVEKLLPYCEMMTLTPLGEPLLWSGLGGLLEYHAKIGSHNLAMTSNGMLLNDKNCERLVRGQVSEFYVSIDTNDPNVYQTMRVGGDLREVEAGLRRLNEWKKKLGSPWPRLHCNATFMERNIRQLPSMVAWADELGFSQLSVQLMEIENPEQESEFLGHHVELARRMVELAIENASRLNFNLRPHLALTNLLSASGAGRNVARHNFTAASPIMPESVKGESRRTFEAGVQTGDGRLLVEKCSDPWFNVLIDTDGDVRPCCWTGMSWGNLNRLEFDRIWNGQPAIAMRETFLKDFIPPACRNKHCRVDL